MTRKRNSYGNPMPPAAASLTKAMADTRRAIELQHPAAAFEAIPETRQWTCACGGVNAANRNDCRWCGADRKVQT
jgi:hypothetical protein